MTSKMASRSHTKPSHKIVIDVISRCHSRTSHLDVESRRHNRHIFPLHFNASSRYLIADEFCTHAYNNNSMVKSSKLFIADIFST